MRGFAARRRLIGPAFAVALALNHDLYLPEDPQRLPVQLPRSVIEAGGHARAESRSWGAAPVPAAVAPKRAAAPVVLAPEADPAARRDAIEKRLRAAGARTPAFVRMRALAELATPLARVGRALAAARQQDDGGEERRLLESALANADADDVVTRERILRQLAAALAKAGQRDAARARAKEARDAYRRITEIEIAELEDHKQSQQAKARREALQKLAKEPVRAPGEGFEEDRKKAEETREKLAAMLSRAPPSEAAEAEALAKVRAGR